MNSSATTIDATEPTTYCPTCAESHYWGEHTRSIPAPAPQRVPTVWGPECRYCQRYSQPCGRHEDLTLVVGR